MAQNTNKKTAGTKNGKDIAEKPNNTQTTKPTKPTKPTNEPSIIEDGDEKINVQRKTMSIKKAYWELITLLLAHKSPNPKVHIAKSIIDEYSQKKELTKVEEVIMEAQESYIKELTNLTLIDIFLKGLEAHGFDWETTDDIENAMNEDSNRLMMLQTIKDKKRYEQLGLSGIFSIPFNERDAEINRLTK